MSAGLIAAAELKPAEPKDQLLDQTAAAQSSGPGGVESPNDLFLNVGKSVLVDSALPIERVSVGFGEVAEATAVGPQEVLVNGKTPGQTSMIVWQQGGSKLFFDVTVQPSRFANDGRLETLRRQLEKELPDSKIDATVEGDLVFLRGTVRNLISANRAVMIASAVGKPVNLLYVDVPPPEPQILLKVKFASVDRSLSTEVGINIFSTGATNTIGAITTGQFSPPVISSNSGSNGSTSGGTSGGIVGSRAKVTLSNALNLFFFRPDLDFGATIQALQTRGLLEILAEPNVLAQNGKQASFLAGGEFPFPVVQSGGVGGTNAITIEFRQFGVRLNFIPTITPRGTIALQVAPEVSSLDFTNGLVIQGFTVPGVNIRNVSTEVELGTGQSFAIGGLLDNRETESFSKIPLIGDIPILGKLFQSKAKSRSNTELMVIVTPEIVRPVPPSVGVPAINYPVPFLPPNSGVPMATPGQDVTGPVPVAPPTPTMPVESLIRSIQTERPLIVNPTSGPYGTAPGNPLTPSAPVSAAPPILAPPAGPTPPLSPAAPPP